MRAFLYGAFLQWKLDIRNKGILITYYIVPLVFYGFMGSIFTSINPAAKDTLIQSMSVFGITMGAILGAPIPLVEMYGTEILKAYKVGHIPLWVGAANNFISALAHLLIMSLIIYATAPFAFGAKVPENSVLFFGSLLLFIIVSLSVGTLLGLFVKGTAKLTMFSQFIFLPSLMLSGIMFPANLLPKAFGYVGKIFPATWGFESMIGSTFGIGTIWPLIAIFILSAAVCGYRLAKVGIE